MQQAGVGSENEAQHAEQQNQEILPQHPIVSAQAVRPERHNLDYWRKD